MKTPNSFTSTSCAFLAVLALLGLGPSLAQDSTVNTKAVMLSLSQLQGEVMQADSAGNEVAKEAACRRILQVGAPLLSRAMSPDAAEQMRSSGTQSDSGVSAKTYAGFWKLRALASVLADNHITGRQAAAVLKTLGVDQSDNNADVEVVASLISKGWLGTSPAGSAGQAEPQRVYGLEDIFDGTPYDTYNSYSKILITRKAQEKLKSAGLYRSGIDGKPGAGTCAAIREWQSQHNLSASGQLDSATIKSLGVSGFSESTPPPPQPQGFVGNWSGMVNAQSSFGLAPTRTSIQVRDGNQVVFAVSGQSTQGKQTGNVLSWSCRLPAWAGGGRTVGHTGTLLLSGDGKTVTIDESTVVYDSGGVVLSVVSISGTLARE